MKSMTGFGKAVLNKDDYSISVEVKSVNSRFLNTRISLPRDFNFLEVEIEKKIKEYITRGKVNVYIELSDRRAEELELNEEKLQQHWKMYQKAAKLLKIEPQVDLNSFLKSEGIVSNKMNKETEEINSAMLKILESALAQQAEMAIREGNSMKDYFIQSINIMQNSIQFIKKKFPKYRESIHEKTKKNVESLLKQHLSKENYQRILLESAIYVEKADVTEEIVRFEDHLTKFKKKIEKENAGKSINFILQEMHREINTIGSKFTSEDVFDKMILLKEEIEKCRELVQNVE